MKVSFVVLPALLMAISEQCMAEAGAESKFKHMTMPVVKMSLNEIKKYRNDPGNKPKLDFKPTGQKSQPKSAGISYLKGVSGQIIGGEAAAQKQFPWQVYLNVDDAWLCGGSMISASWVLTAAHCAYKASTFVVTVGGVDRLTNETGEMTKTSKVAFVHEKYNRFSLINDIALIKLPTPFKLDQNINVIKLPKQINASQTFEGSEVTVSGYGMIDNTGPPSSTMNFVELKIIPNLECASIYGSKTVISSCICTAASANKSICSGDSGGPLMLKDSDGKFIQIGIVSFGSSQSCTHYPTGYSRVTSFLGWISEKTGIKLQ